MLRKKLLLLLSVALLILGCAIGLSTHAAGQGTGCLGTEWIAEADAQKLLEKLPAASAEAVLPSISYNGEKAPADTASATIYLSVSAEQNTKADELSGTLTASDGYTLYFLRDSSCDAVGQAIAENHLFTLYAVGKDSIAVFSVVFTTLPVMSITQESYELLDPPGPEMVQAHDENGDLIYENGEIVYVESDEPVDYDALLAEATVNDLLYSGQMTLWDPSETNLGSVSATVSDAQWNVRGATSKYENKKAWKLALKKSNGKKRELSLLDMDEDDDWILNPMWQDDLKIREKLCMDIWDGVQQTAETALPMSHGEYVELIRDGEYVGLYLLQTRVDQKSLSLDEDDALFKGLAWNTWYWDAYTAHYFDVFRIVYSNTDANSTLARIVDYYNQYMAALDEADPDTIDWASLVDFSLLVQFGDMKDNIGTRNVFFLIRNTDGADKVYYIPWDTDLCFGLIWTLDDGWYYDADLAYNVTDYQREEVALLADNYPEIYTALKERWQQLADVYDVDALSAKAEEYTACLNAAGAMARDQAKWGVRRSEDTLEGLENWLTIHKQLMDTYYEEEKYAPPVRHIEDESSNETTDETGEESEEQETAEAAEETDTEEPAAESQPAG